MHLGFVTGLVLLLVPLANCITSCPSEMAPKIKLTYFDIEGAYKYLAWWKAGTGASLFFPVRDLSSFEIGGSHCIG
jgi:hypothetical protein